jgi:flagellar basal-body rod protein FlgB
MFIERLLNQGNAPLLEQMLRFTEARQKLLTDDVANASTPGFQMKDLDPAKFQEMLAKRVEERDVAAPGTVGFSDISAEVEKPHDSILFHDRNNRSMEELMSDNAKTGLLHNMLVEILRKQYGVMEMALKERVT